MPAISKILKSPLKWSCWVRKPLKNFSHCRHIWSLSDTIAGIYGPYRDWNCRHIWSLSWSRLHACMVLILTEIAAIFGPQRNCYCRLIWSLTNIAGILGPPYILYMYFLRNVSSNVLWIWTWATGFLKDPRYQDTRIKYIWSYYITYIHVFSWKRFTKCTKSMYFLYPVSYTHLTLPTNREV